MKGSFYFSHDYNTRTDTKIKKLISKHGMAGYGIFWAIVEDLYQNANALPSDCDLIAFDLRTDTDTINSVLHDFGLFTITDGMVSSDSVRRRLEELSERSEKARQSANNRWFKKGNANAMRSHNEPNAIKLNEIKIKENNNTTTTTTRVREEIFDFFKKKAPEGCNTNEEAEKFIHMNSIKNWAAAGGIENWRQVAELYILRIIEHQKHKPNGRTGKVHNTGYNESIANADRIIEQLARGK